MRIRLEAAECNDIAVAAFNAKRYASALQWLDAAWNRLFDDDETFTVPMELVQKNFYKAMSAVSCPFSLDTDEFALMMVTIESF